MSTITFEFKQSKITVHIDLNARTPIETPQVASLTTNGTIGQAEVIQALRHLQAQSLIAWGDLHQVIDPLEDKIKESITQRSELHAEKEKTFGKTTRQAHARMRTIWHDIRAIDNRIEQCKLELKKPKADATAFMHEYADIQFVLDAMEKCKDRIDEHLVPFKTYSISLNPEFDDWVASHAA